MRRLICALMALALLLGLTACGGKEGGTPSKQEAPSSSSEKATEEASEPESAAQSEPESEPESAAQPETGGPASFSECRGQLLAYYTYEPNGKKKEFFACAIEKPKTGILQGYNLHVKDDNQGPWLTISETENWRIYFTDEGFDEGVQLSDIVIDIGYVSDSGEEENRTFSDWGEPAAPETLPEYGIFPVGEHYAVLSQGYVETWKNETYAELYIPVPNVYLDGHEPYAEDALTTEMFSLYAADGKSLEEAVGLPVLSCIIEKGPYGSSYIIRFDGESAGLDTAGVAKAIQEHAGYYVYHCPNGTDYTVNFSLEEE